jgi:hypothetical protein
VEHIVPKPEMFILPAGTRLIPFAMTQAHLGYEPLIAIVTTDGRVTSQWLPDTEELKRLQAGEPLTLIVHTHNQGLPPVSLSVGGFDLT